MRAFVMVKLITVIALGMALLNGCTANVSRPTPVAQTEPTNYSSDIQTTVPPGLALFGDYPELEQVPFENRLITNLRQHTFTTEGLDFDPDLAKDGELLVFASTRNAEHPDIYLKKPEGSALTQLTGDPADDIQPRFSPDNQQVVFCSNRAGNWDIWLMNTDGTGLTQLTQDRSDEVAPSWAPDGTQVAYTVWGYSSHRWEIWTLDVDKPGVRRFLVYGMFPAWSPDGTRIAYQRARQRGSRWFSVWTIKLVDGEARHPTEIAHSDSSACIAPCWSPDGSMIVYSTVRPDREQKSGHTANLAEADLWSIDPESGLRMKLTDGASTAFNPVWSPKGRIFFVSARTGTENIWSLTTDLTAYAQGGHDAPRVSHALEDKPAQMDSN